MTPLDVQAMLDGSLKRTVVFAEALDELDRAATEVLAAAQRVLPLEIAGENSGTDLHALHALLMSTRAKLAEQAQQCAAQHGWQVATYLIEPEVRGQARQADSDPIVWLTGNSMMPPLREYANGNDIWHAAQQEGVWTAYAEALEKRLDELEISMQCPDYDNALYAVDLRRWQYRDESEDAENLQDEWELRDDA